VVSVNVSVTMLLGFSSSSVTPISVKAKAVLPYSSNAHPRILPRVFWSTVFSLVDTVSYGEISIKQGRGNNNMKPLDIEIIPP
jgi:hypothetical protein